MNVQGKDDQPAPRAAVGAEDEGAAETNRFLNLLRQKSEDLVASGLRQGHARGLAQLELRIAQWPCDWGSQRDQSYILHVCANQIADPRRVTHSRAFSDACVCRR